MTIGRVIILACLNLSIVAGSLLLWVLCFFTFLGGMDAAMVAVCMASLAAYFAIIVVSRKVKAGAGGPWLVLASIIIAIAFVGFAVLLPNGLMDSMLAPLRFIWNKEA